MAAPLFYSVRSGLMPECLAIDEIETGLVHKLVSPRHSVFVLALRLYKPREIDCDRLAVSCRKSSVRRLSYNKT